MPRPPIPSHHSPTMPTTFPTHQSLHTPTTPITCPTHLGHAPPTYLHTHLTPAASRLLNVAPPPSQAALQTTPDITTIRLEVKCAAITLVLHKLVYGPRSSFLCYQGCYAACCLQSWLYVSAPYGEGQQGTVFIYSGQNGSLILRPLLAVLLTWKNPCWMA